MKPTTFSNIGYEFTSYTHDEIISALEDFRKANNMHKSSMSKKLGYDASMYCKLLNNNIRFSKHSFFRFSEKYAPQLLTSKTESIYNNKEQECITYLKSKGYKILKPVTDYVEL